MNIGLLTSFTVIRDNAIYIDIYISIEFNEITKWTVVILYIQISTNWKRYYLVLINSNSTDAINVQ
jgi:hypothetical protein